MAEFLEKLSSYNLFNNLLPGVVFVVFAEKLTSFHIAPDDLVLGIFFYYFVGLVISRVGSLVLEPAMRLVRFVRFAPYEEFVAASKEDGHLAVLSETNNMYRTFCSLFIMLLLLKAGEVAVSLIPELKKWGVGLLVATLLLLFIFSYRKQTRYIFDRIQCREKE